MLKRPFVNRDWAIGLLLFAVTLLLYLRAVGNRFIDWDDDQYVFTNSHVQSGIATATFTWAATTFAAANWHPITWLSHALDCQVFGLRPAGHHFTNVLLQSLNALLVFVFLRVTTGRRWPSAFAAALFAWHPLRVESVAWVSERKDVLCAFFFLLSLLAYQWYARRPGVARYALMALCFAAGLLAKPMIVTFPFVLLLLDFWPLQRFTSERFAWLLLEKMPLVLIGAADAAMTWFAQRAGGAIKHLTLGDRVANAVMSYARYIGKTLYPTDLVVFYWQRFWLAYQVVPVVISLGTLTAIFVLQCRSRPYLIVGWLWFLGMLIPTIGLVQVGGQSMADRCTYLPSIGLAVLLAWGAADLAGRWPRCTWPVPSIAVVLLAILAGMTWRQIGVWHDTYSLFSHSLHSPDDQAIDHFLRYSDQLLLASRLTPPSRRSLAVVHCDWGDALFRAGRPAQAAVHYKDASFLDPEMIAAQEGLARCGASNQPKGPGAFP